MDIWMTLSLIVLTGLTLSKIPEIKEKMENRKKRRTVESVNSNAVSSAGSAAEPSTNTAEDPQQDRTPVTRNIMLNILRTIGCQPEIDDEGRIMVPYQGENFQILCGGAYARIWDPGWAQIAADNPYLPVMREANNYTNHNSGPTVVISDPDEQGMRYIHTKADVMLHPLCPENDQYVHAILNSFFPIKETMHYKFMELKSRQTEATAPNLTSDFTSVSQN